MNDKKKLISFTQNFTVQFNLSTSDLSNRCVMDRWWHGQCIRVILQGSNRSLKIWITRMPEKPISPPCRDGRTHIDDVLFTRVTLMHRGPNGDGFLWPGEHDCKPFRLTGLCLWASFILTSKRRFFGTQHHPHTHN